MRIAIIVLNSVIIIICAVNLYMSYRLKKKFDKMGGWLSPDEAPSMEDDEGVVVLTDEREAKWLKDNG